MIIVTTRQKRKYENRTETSLFISLCIFFVLFCFVLSINCFFLRTNTCLFSFFTIFSSLLIFSTVTKPFARYSVLQPNIYNLCSTLLCVEQTSRNLYTYLICVYFLIYDRFSKAKSSHNICRFNILVYNDTRCTISTTTINISLFFCCL